MKNYSKLIIIFAVTFLLGFFFSCGSHMVVNQQKDEDQNAVQTQPLPDPIPTITDSTIRIEDCVDWKDMIGINDGKLYWYTPFKQEDQAYRPGEHPDCKTLDKVDTFVTIDGIRFKLPIDDVHWEKILYGYLPGPNLPIVYWHGEFDLSEFGIDLKVLADKDEIFKDIKVAEGRGKVELSDKKANEIWVWDPDTTSGLEGAGFYDFNFTYEYYVLK